MSSACQSPKLVIGERVQEQLAIKGQELIEFWDPTIKKAGLDDTVIVVVTNSNEFENIKLTAKAGTEVKAEDEVMTLAAKEKVEAKQDKNYGRRINYFRRKE